MTPAFEKLQKHLKQLPGLGYRSSERIALHLLVEKPAELAALVTALEEAARRNERTAAIAALAALETQTRALLPALEEALRPNGLACESQPGAPTAPEG